MSKQPIHISHCPECGGSGQLEGLLKPERSYPCHWCEGTGHLVLPFYMEVTLQSQYQPEGGQNGSDAEG